MYTLCDTADSASAAIASLSSASILFLDCEGRDLGTDIGALSLIQVGAPDVPSIYLFDALLLPSHSLQPLLTLLASKEPMKVVWDGRMDYVELLFSLGTRLAGVLDLQVADVASRARRGESDFRRMGRLGRWDFPISQVKKLQLEGINTLNSLDSALREHGVSGVAPKPSEWFRETWLSMTIS